MQIPRWKDPGRKRNITISYTDPNYTVYYDLDVVDFEKLVNKIKSGKLLTEQENDRYGIYIITISLMVLDGPKFKRKTHKEKEEIIEYQCYELLTGLPKFNPDKGKIYSFAYRIAYTSACHYYTDKITDYRKNKAIKEHCDYEIEAYKYEESSHKVSNLNMEK